MTSVSAPSPTDASAASVRDWLRVNAHPIPDTDPAHTGPDLDALIARLGAATVVGLGESTRFSRQTYGVRERIFRALVERHGFRVLAIQDSARSGDRLDTYVRTGAGTAEAALAEAWRPLRTAEMVATLAWIRAFNEQHPVDPIGILGVQPPHAEPTDYDAVLDYVRRAAPELSDTIAAHLTPIRTAHRIDEHVQRHQGIHPGRPFIDHARDALALLEELPETPERDAALTRARFIADFHLRSVAGQGGFARDEWPSAERILERATDTKIVYWDGIAHTAGVALGVGRTTAAAFLGAGSHLRERLGVGYAAVGVGFHHGDLGMTVAPDPSPDLVDAALGTVDQAAYYVDLRADAPEPVDHWRRGSAKLRTISGIYDPAKDAEANLEVTSLIDAFDALIHIRETSPVGWLPEFAAATE
ncbi:erythromycin esterase family protein [Nocardia sp. NPDC050710]|uniref:erythromycin esterase family protein n=1 Tax=Nocardia sp. NPDC050710 TaxID=3157220 RepID=UPI00340A018E